MGRDKKKRRIYHKKWEKENEEYLREYRAKHYQEHKEQIAAQQKLYHERNKERINARKKEWTQEKLVDDPDYDKKRSKKYYLKNEKRELTRARGFKRKYNLTLEEIDAMLFRQNFSCPICRKDLRIFRRHIDHNHKTGKIRGILCGACNAGIGMLGDNVEVLSKAIDYLQREDNL